MEQPPTKKYKSMLEESEGEMQDAHEYEAPDEAPEEGPPSPEEEAEALEPPRKVLRTTIAAEDAHPSYEVRRQKKRPIDFKEISEATTRTRKTRRTKFKEFVSRQSLRSI